MTHGPANDPDTRLMLELQAGDRHALGVLFERNHARVHALCARLVHSTDAEDLVQETFLRVQRHARTFEGGAGFTPWLFRIARNVCHDRGSRMKRRAGVEARWAVERNVREPLDAAERFDRRRLVERALEELSAEDREVIVLSRMHDLPYADIAATLGCSAGAARVRLHRALARLREHIAGLEGADDGLRSRPRAHG